MEAVGGRPGKRQTEDSNLNFTGLRFQVLKFGLGFRTLGFITGFEVQAFGFTA